MSPILLLLPLCLMLILQTLDTLDVSNKVKEILSVHNIGQRVFAKQVLGLSQGTVSELLSKPKHWDKLTEKGRESYRKMYYWLQDIRNIDALKNASPRKRRLFFFIFMPVIKCTGVIILSHRYKLGRAFINFQNCGQGLLGLLSYLDLFLKFISLICSELSL